MSDSPIASFMAELGFKGDTTAAKKVVELQKQTEAAITAAAEDGAKKREAIEAGAGTKRLGLAEGLGKILGELEQQRADRAAAIKKSEAAQDEKLQGERERKEKERRARTVVELRQHATRMATFALKLVGGVEATALGIVVAVDRAAKSMERLGYASARAGTTSGKMTATGYAFSQMGSTAEAGQAAVRTLGEKLKENPNGYASYLKSMGVEAKKANGELRDTNDIAVDVGEALARIRKNGGALGYSKAKAYGAGLGWDGDQVQTSMDPRYRRFVGEQQAIDAKVGTDRDAGAESGSKFETSMRRLETTIDSLKTKVATDLAKNIQPTLDKLADWAASHGKEISDTVVKVADGIIRLANAVIDNLSKVDWNKVIKDIESFGDSLNKKMNEIFGDEGKTVLVLAGFAAAITAKVLGPLRLVLSTLQLIGGVPLIGRLLGGTVATAASVPALAGAAVVAGGLADAEMAKRTGAAMSDPNAKFDPETGFVNDLDFGFGDKGANNGSGASATGGLWDKLKSMVGIGPSDPDSRKVKDAIIATAEGVKKLADSAGGVGGVTSSSGGLGGTGQHFGGGSSAGASLGDHARGGIGRGAAAMEGGARESFEFWKSKGLTPEQAAGLVGMEQGESQFNPRAVGDNGQAHGAFQWHADRRADIRAGAGIDVDTATHAQQLEAAYYEFQHKEAAAWAAIKKSRTASDAARAGVYHFERPGDKEGQSIVRGGMGEGWLKRFNGQDASPAPGGTTAGDVGSKIASMKSAGLLTDEQCVTLAMAAVGVKKGSGQAGANVHEWRKGDGADAGTLKAGTPVATFLDRQGRETDRYAGGGAGTPGAHLDHAGVFQKYVMDAYGKRIGMTIAEQYQGSHGVHLKDYLFGKGFGEANGSNYHAVLGPDGKPLGGGQAPASDVKAAPAASWHQSPLQATKGGGPNALTDLYGAGFAKQPVKVDVTPASAERIGHGMARGAALGHHNEHLVAAQAILRAHHGYAIPGVNPHSSLARHIRNSIDASHRNVSQTHNPTFNIYGAADTGAAMADAHRLAGRGQADMVRNMISMTT